MPFWLKPTATESRQGGAGIGDGGLCIAISILARLTYFAKNAFQGFRKGVSCR